MINKVKSSQCCGCTACASVCPEKCINFGSDELGFMYPVIDMDKCIGCNTCERICPSLSTKKISDKYHQVIGAVSTSEEVRVSSSSGGVFTEVARYVFSKDGIVYGTSMTDDFYGAKYSAATTDAELVGLRSSKYLQSNIWGCFTEIKDLLLSGRIVAFSGTPCQVAGLKAFLKKDYENLITIDIVCHGVPSPKVWESYMLSLEKKHRSKVCNVSFRYKTPGESGYSLKVDFINGDKLCEKCESNLYLRGFSANLYLRESCFKCKQKGVNRESDLTLGDFWGVENYFPNLEAEKGVSIVVIHSLKGKEIIDAIRKKLMITQTDDIPLLKHNSCSVKSTPKPKNYAKFRQEFLNKEFEKVMRSQFGVTYQEKLKAFIKRAIR
jgi:coenzyme F420-reducing hydrogenase beta subunit